MSRCMIISLMNEMSMMIMRKCKKDAENGRTPVFISVFFFSFFLEVFPTTGDSRKCVAVLYYIT
jgi:hypothetical protein